MGFLICRMCLLERAGVRLGDGARRIRGPRDHVDLRRLLLAIDELGNHARIERSAQGAAIGGVVQVGVVGLVEGVERGVIGLAGRRSVDIGYAGRGAVFDADGERHVVRRKGFLILLVLAEGIGGVIAVFVLCRGIGIGRWIGVGRRVGRGRWLRLRIGVRGGASGFGCLFKCIVDSIADAFARIGGAAHGIDRRSLCRDDATGDGCPRTTKVGLIIHATYELD